ncbi:cation:proton antiporter [Amycolatopsis sp. NPDC021455]|uniref:cation:proton antiporter n=1 Tax=Amycolatopsis sp. NPDC021455 TaxID=3154901 RepID=UPI0033FE30EE
MSELAVLLAALAVLLGLARLAGAATARLGQPAVLGEILCGVAVAPAARLLPARVDTTLTAIAQLGLVLFLFAAGAHLAPSLSRSRLKAVVVPALGATLVPLALGAVLALWLARRHAPAGTGPFVVFVAAAMAVTALPVLARILAERGLADSTTGRRALSAAAGSDVTAWTLLAVAAAALHGWSAIASLPVAALLAVVPWLGRRRWIARLSRPSATVVFVALACAAAAVTEVAGLHPAIGAFFAGVVLGHAIPALDPAVGPAVPALGHAEAGPVPVVGSADSAPVSVVGAADPALVPVLGSADSAPDSVVGSAAPVVGSADSAPVLVVGAADPALVPVLGSADSAPDSVVGSAAPVRGSADPAPVLAVGAADPALVPALGSADPVPVPVLGAADPVLDPVRGSAAPTPVPAPIPADPAPAPALAPAAPALDPAALVTPVASLLAPLYFVLVGRAVDLGRLDAGLATDIAAVAAVAVAGKLAGAYLGARLGGLAPHPAGVFAVLMNTRGVTELVFVAIGLGLGVIDGALYTAMVVMALATTAMTGPLLTRLSRQREGV